MVLRLRCKPVEERTVPSGLVQVNGEYYYAESPPGVGVTALEAAPPPVPVEQKVRDAVRNELF